MYTLGFKYRCQLNSRGSTYLSFNCAGNKVIFKYSSCRLYSSYCNITIPTLNSYSFYLFEKVLQKFDCSLQNMYQVTDLQNLGTHGQRICRNARTLPENSFVNSKSCTFIMWTFSSLPQSLSIAVCDPAGPVICIPVGNYHNMDLLALAKFSQNCQ